MLWGNQEWTIQRHWQHWTHKTQHENKQNKNTTQNNKFTNYNRGRHSHNRMVVGFITTYAIIVYHH
jgi:hypothetical protein